MRRSIFFLCLMFCCLAGGVLGKESAPPKKVTLAPGEWEPVFGLDNHLFPSAIIVLSTVNAEALKIEPDPDSFGSPLGMVSVSIRGKAAGDKVAVEVSSTKLIAPSRLEATLADAKKVYSLRPHLKYEYEKLLAVRQPYPEDVTVKVYLNGVLLGEKTQTVVVRSINDCFFEIVDENPENDEDWTEMFAAYVNESHPVVDQILSEALKKNYTAQFSGYQGTEEDVSGEVAAVWMALKDRGLRYSDITTTAAESQNVKAQHVRMLGDSTSGAQANCVDGSVLFASIFRKIGLNTFLVLLPEHMMVAVALDNQEKNIIYIETTMLAEASIEEAVEAAKETLKKHKENEISLISINEARAAGILPLREIKEK